MSVIAYVKGPGRDQARERFAAAVALVEVRERRMTASSFAFDQAADRYEQATARYRAGLQAFLAKRWN